MWGSRAKAAGRSRAKAAGRAAPGQLGGAAPRQLGAAPRQLVYMGMLCMRWTFMFTLVSMSVFM